MRDILYVTNRPKLKGSLFDHPLEGGGRAVGMGRFLRLPTGERQEVDWAQMTVPDCMFRQLAPDIAQQLGITEFVAPDPNVDAPTRSPEEMPSVLQLGEEVTLRYGVAADGCYPLRKHQAYILRSGGCPALRVHYPGNPALGIAAKTAAGHGSLKSLLKHLPATLIRDMGLTEEERKKTFVSVVAPISPKHFTHSTRNKKYGEENRKLCEEIVAEFGMQSLTGIKEIGSAHHLGQINLGEIAIVQFKRLGIPHTNISVLANNVDDSPRHTDGSSRWYTTRNCPQYTFKPEEDAAWRKKRNLIILTSN